MMSLTIDPDAANMAEQENLLGLVVSIDQRHNRWYSILCMSSYERGNRC